MTEQETVSRMFEPRRELGRTGFQATALGIGDVADRAVPIERCIATVRRAMDAGLNLVDTAPGYEHGYSEEVVGRAVREHLAAHGGRRGGLFVIDKIDFMDQPVAPQVDKSLGLLKLDGVDLFVFHALSDLALWRQIASPGGAMDELAACVKAGKTRFRGISSHHPDVLCEAIESGLCDVVMYPIGPFVDVLTERLPVRFPCDSRRRNGRGATGDSRKKEGCRVFCRRLFCNAMDNSLDREGAYHYTSLLLDGPFSCSQHPAPSGAGLSLGL